MFNYKFNLTRESDSFFKKQHADSKQKFSLFFSFNTFVQLPADYEDPLEP